MSKSPIVFLHTAKTGGTSLKAFVGSFFRFPVVCPATLPTQLNAYTDAELRRYALFAGHFGFEDCQNLPIKASYITLLRDPVDRVVSLYYWWNSHADKQYDGTPQTDPNYRGVKLAMKSSLEDFIDTDDPSIKCEISNTQTRYILSGTRSDYIETLDPKAASTRAADKLLSEFAWFGTIESLSSSAEEIKSALKLTSLPHRAASIKHRNKGMQYLNQGNWDKLKINPETAAKIRRLNQVDTRLYYWAKYYKRQFGVQPAPVALKPAAFSPWQA